MGERSGRGWGSVTGARDLIVPTGVRTCVLREFSCFCKAGSSGVRKVSVWPPSQPQSHAAVCGQREWVQACG